MVLLVSLNEGCFTAFFHKSHFIVAVRRKYISAKHGFRSRTKKEVGNKRVSPLRRVCVCVCVCINELFSCNCPLDARDCG